MGALRTLGRLDSRERALVMWTLLLVAAIRAALWAVSFRRVQRLTRTFQRLPVPAADLPVSRFVWAVRAASRRVPAASCLTQALALQTLLLAVGYAPQMHIGVAKDPERGFEAHAWVELDGRTLLTKPSDVGRFVKILLLENERR